MRTGVAAVLALLAFAGARTSAAADDDAADARLKEGTQAFRAGQLEVALAKFVEARSLRSSPRLEYNLAETLLALKRDAEAADAFDAFLEHGPTEAAAFRDEARRQLAALSARTSEVAIGCAPPDFSVVVDGEALTLPRASDRFRVSPGPHDVAVARPDHSELASRRIDGKRGQRVALSLCAPPNLAAPALVATPPAAIVATPRADRSWWSGPRIAVAVGVVVILAAGAIAAVAASRSEPPGSSLGNYPL